MSFSERVQFTLVNKGTSPPCRQYIVPSVLKHLIELCSPSKERNFLTQMNMLECDGNSCHATRESYSYLSDLEWSAVERMISVVGEDVAWNMLSTLYIKNIIPPRISSYNIN